MSEFLRHEPCPNCGSKDNLARYTDGHAYCFGCDHYEHSSSTEVKETYKVTDLIEYEVVPLLRRGIDEETCKKWRYGVGTFNGRPVKVAN